MVVDEVFQRKLMEKLEVLEKKLTTIENLLTVLLREISERNELEYFKVYEIFEKSLEESGRLLRKLVKEQQR